MGRDYSQSIMENKIHVPNHQPESHPPSYQISQIFCPKMNRFSLIQVVYRPANIRKSQHPPRSECRSVPREAFTTTVPAGLIFSEHHRKRTSDIGPKTLVVMKMYI
jgi:hypothetical protein